MKSSENAPKVRATDKLQIQQLFNHAGKNGFLEVLHYVSDFEVLAKTQHSTCKIIDKFIFEFVDFLSNLED
jgi:hypothetical protein